MGGQSREVLQLFIFKEIADIVIVFLGIAAICYPAFILLAQAGHKRVAHTFFWGVCHLLSAPFRFWRDSAQGGGRVLAVALLLVYASILAWLISHNLMRLIDGLVLLLAIYLVSWALLGAMRMSLSFVRSVPLRPLLIYSLFMPPLAMLLFIAWRSVASGLVLHLTLVAAHIMVLAAMLLCVLDIRNIASQDEKFRHTNLIFGVLLLLFNLLFILCAESIAIMWTAPHLGGGTPYLSRIGTAVTDWPDMVYFTFVTFATVGFGDVVPNTLWAKFQTCTTIVSSIFFLSIFIATVGADAGRLLLAGEQEVKADEESETGE